MKHELKIWPENMEAILSGKKKAEIRVNDRGYQVGDLLILREWEPRTEKYGTRETSLVVTWIDECPSPTANIKSGYVVLSFEFASFSANVARLEREKEGEK
jgi:hypothetical protein